MGDVGFVLVWMLTCVAFTAYGYYALRATREAAERFRRLGTTMFGERIASHVYKEEGLRVAARIFLIGGPVLFGIGAVVLIVSLLQPS